MLTKNNSSRSSSNLFLSIQNSALNKIEIINQKLRNRGNSQFLGASKNENKLYQKINNMISENLCKRIKINSTSRNM